MPTNYFKALPIGAKGELCIKGPNIMTGYVGEPQDSSSVQTADGFFKTGDIGYVDKNGYVFLEDRAKDMIKVKGSELQHQQVFRCTALTDLCAATKSHQQH